MKLLVNGKEIIASKVVVVTDNINAMISMEDKSGIFYESKTYHDTTITIHEDLLGWSDFNVNAKTSEAPTKTDTTGGKQTEINFVS